jgi:ABC-type transport system substrate-binding protein
MAERWESSPDGLTWTFYLRDGVIWSDGDPVDVNDFKFIYDALMSDQVESPHRAIAAQIESVEVVDSLTVVVKYKEVRCDALQTLN